MIRGSKEVSVLSILTNLVGRLPPSSDNDKHKMLVSLTPSHSTTKRGVVYGWV